MGGHLFRWTIILCVLLSSVSFAAGSSDPGGLAVGVRSLAMGRAMVAAVQDSHAVFINPANLSYISESHFSSFFSRLFGDFGYTNLVGGFKNGNIWWGVGLSMVSLDGIPQNITVPYGIETRIAQTGQYTASDTLWALSYAQYLGNFLFLEDSVWGVTGKYFSQRIDTAVGTLVGGDFGLKFKFGGLNSLPLLGSYFRKAQWGFVAYNPVGFTLANAVNVQSLEAHYRVGVSGVMDVPVLNRPINTAFDFDTMDGFHAGGEFWLDPQYALRGGWDAGRLTLGGGLVIKDFSGFDYNPHTLEFGYAIKFYEEQLGLGHFFSITYRGVSYTETPEIIKPNSAFTTAVNRVDLQGKAVPNSEVKIYEGDNLKTSAPVNEAGVWNVQGLTLKRGTNIFSATAEAQGLVESPRSQTVRVLYKADLKALRVTVKRTALDVLIFAETPETLSEMVALLPNGEKINLKYFESDKNWQAYWQLPADYTTQPFTIKLQGKDVDGNVTPVETQVVENPSTVSSNTVVNP